MAIFNLTRMAVNMYCPDNAVHEDDAGLPSILAWIPAFKLSEVLNTEDESIHPAFIVNGKKIPGFYYSKYENVVYNGRAYSLPGEDPASNIDFETCKSCSEAKGNGWHLSTAAEWAAIALWCKKKGQLPYGNARNGKDSRETEIKAIPSSYTANGEVARVATGTGPLTWSHDRTASGIWDMGGNVSEWQNGLRIVWGELQIMANNDAADPDNPANATSTCWKAINAATGELVEPESSPTDTAGKYSGSTVKLDWIANVWTYSTSISSLSSTTTTCNFGAISCDESIGEAAKTLLRALALLPEEGEGSMAYDGDKVYCTNNASERLVYRGGGYSGGTDSGIFAIYMGLRANKSESNGFRSAYIPNI